MAGFVGENLACVRGERVVFRHLDFQLEPGGALILAGPNGSGKSSLLRVMAGLLEAYEGRLQWAGEDIGKDFEAHNARLHYVGDHDTVKPALTVFENTAFWAGLRGGKKQVPEALDAFAIQRLAGVAGRFLSAGQKRRVNLSRILATPAPLWLLDEPATALDKATVAAFEKIIAKHRKDGGMVVFSTHAEIFVEGARVLNLANFAPGRPETVA